MKHGAVRLTHLEPAAADQSDHTGSAGTSAQSSPQVAFALGRRFGTAVERNRARRRLRDAFALAWNQRQQNSDPRLQLHGAFLLSGHRGLLTSPFERLVTDVDRCFAQLVATSAESTEAT